MGPKRQRASSQGSAEKLQKRQKPDMTCLCQDTSMKVEISLGEPVGTITVPKEDLLRMCTYFRDWDRQGWPERFFLRPHKDPQQCAVLPAQSESVQTFGETVDGIEDCNKDVVSYAQKLNQIIFRLLQHEKLDDNIFEGNTFRSQILRDATILAASYGCLLHVRSDLLLLVRSSDGKFLKQQSCITLETAFLLEDESLYVDAMRHAAGQRAASESNQSVLPEHLDQLVTLHSESIKTKVLRACNGLILQSNQEVDLSRFLAFAAFHHHLLSRVFPTSPAGHDRFRELSYISGLRTGHDLLSGTQLARVFTSINTIDEGLLSGYNALCDVHEEIRDDHSLAIHKMDEGFDQKLNVGSVKSNLQQIVKQASHVLEPLFVGDRNANYFTCIEAEQPVPWTSR